MSDKEKLDEFEGKEIWLEGPVEDDEARDLLALLLISIGLILAAVGAQILRWLL